MDTNIVTQVLREGVWTILKTGGPMLFLSMMVGVALAIFQAVTQVHEQTLSFIFKLTMVLLYFFVAGGWMMETILEYARGVFAIMATTR